MRIYWGALVADFRRYYRIGPADVGALPTWEFWALLTNLPADGAWRQRCDNHPRRVSAAEAQAIADRLAAR